MKNIFNGNLAIFDWRILGKGDFAKSEKTTYWVQKEGRRILAGHYNSGRMKCNSALNKSNLRSTKCNEVISISGGNLTFLVVRGAGHMVPISQPVTARQIMKDFTNSIHTDFVGSIYKPMVVERSQQCYG